MGCVISVLMILATVPVCFPALLWIKLPFIDKGKHGSYVQKMHLHEYIAIWDHLAGNSHPVPSLQYSKGNSSVYFFCGSENGSPFIFLLVSICSHLFSAQNSSLPQAGIFRSLCRKKQTPIRCEYTSRANKPSHKAVSAFLCSASCAHYRHINFSSEVGYPQALNSLCVASASVQHRGGDGL